MIIDTHLKNCRLRPWRPEDKGDLQRNGNNRKVWLNLTDLFPSPYTAADADFWISQANEPSSNIHLTIEVEGKSAGGIGIITGEGISARTGQFGYWLGEDYWGKGIATSSAKALIGFVRSHMSFARLEASVFEWNPASMRVLEKTGFVQECVRKRSVFKDGKLIDSMMYVLLTEIS